MKILIYGINYAPELTGIGKYSGEMGAFFAAAGHEVEVITAPPYYPHWAVDEAYRGRGWHREEREGVTVLRCPLYVPGEVTGARRIVHELSFLLSSLRWWIPRYFRRYDVILVVSPPFHLGFPALLHKWLRGSRVVNHIQDLQVDAARDLKIIRNRALLRLLEGAERFLLRRMTRVSTISSGMRDKIIAKGVPADRLLMFRNWVDGKTVRPVAREDSLRGEWGYGPADKVVLYAGNLGEKQGLPNVLDLAARLRDRRPDVRFVIVGEGGTKEALVRRAAAEALTNVRFLPLQPLDKLAASLGSADAHLILQLRGAADLVMPSKLTNILAVDGHALITAEPGTTLYDETARYRLGTLAEPENLDAMEERLLAILDGHCAGDADGADHYVEHQLNKTQILSAYLDALNNA